MIPGVPDPLPVAGEGLLVVLVMINFELPGPPVILYLVLDEVCPSYHDVERGYILRVRKRAWEVVPPGCPSACSRGRLSCCCC